MNSNLFLILICIYLIILLNNHNSEYFNTINNLIIVENKNFIFVHIHNKSSESNEYNEYNNYKIYKIYKNILNL